MICATHTSVFVAALLAVVCGPGLASAQGPTCPEGFELFDQTCFTFVTDPLTWEAASENCVSLGASLAVLSNCQLFGDVVRHINLQGYQDSNFWIGATDVAEEGNWLWIDGESVALGPPFWGQTDDVPEPEDAELGNCADLNALDRHYFHDSSCDNEFGSLCEAFPTFPTPPSPVL